MDYTIRALSTDSDGELDRIINSHRKSLRALIYKSDGTLNELIERGRAPQGNFGIMESLGFVELDRGEIDWRAFLGEILPLLLKVQPSKVRCEYYWEEALSTGDIMEWMDRRITWVPHLADIFPQWRHQSNAVRLEALYLFTERTIRDYYLRFLEVVETEEIIKLGPDFPSLNRIPTRITFFPPILTVDDWECEITNENADYVRDWLINAFFEWEEVQSIQVGHIVDAARFADSLCPVSIIGKIGLDRW